MLLLEWVSVLDVIEKLERRGQKKLLKADSEPCFCISWSDKHHFLERNESGKNGEGD